MLCATATSNENFNVAKMHRIIFANGFGLMVIVIGKFGACCSEISFVSLFLFFNRSSLTIVEVPCTKGKGCTPSRMNL